MGATVTEKTTALPSLDLSDPTEARLAGCARRISQLLKSPAVTANADAQSSLDDFLGAVYALIRAKQEGFRDRPRAADRYQARRTARGEDRSRQPQDGRPLDRGVHFNNALFRTAAVYHRTLKVITGGNGYVPALQPIASARYPGWDSAQISKVYSQVNELKHDPRGVYHGCTVTYTEVSPPPATFSTSSRSWAAATAPVPSTPTKKP